MIVYLPLNQLVDLTIPDKCPQVALRNNFDGFSLSSLKLRWLFTKALQVGFSQSRSIFHSAPIEYKTTECRHPSRLEHFPDLHQEFNLLRNPRKDDASLLVGISHPRIPPARVSYVRIEYSARLAPCCMAQGTGSGQVHHSTSSLTGFTCMSLGHVACAIHAL
ncbi:hypothetical protein VTI74DRAFT_2912 [Chaetomium olivicolor]